MSRIAELLKQHCPNGVEYRLLGEVGEFIRGRRFTKNDYVESGLGCIHYGQIYTDYGTAADSTVTFLDAGLRGSLRLARKNDLVIAATGENIEDVCKAVAWLGEEEIAVHDDCYIFRHPFDPKFASYLFQSSIFQEQKVKYANESKVVRISSANLSRIKVPVPPMEIQREIVEILTTMESLEAELKAELKAELRARRRQYAFHYEALLTFPEEGRTKWATLGELAEIGTGSHNTNEGLSVGEYPFFVRSQEVRRLGSYDFDETAIITAGDGVGVGKVFHYVDGKYALHQRAYRIRVTDPSLMPKFYFHYMRSTFGDYMERSAVRSSVTSVRRPMLERYPVPVPDLLDQKRIVDTLDTLDALVNDLSASLPAEIAARRKQYTYYRDRLLTFEEKNAE
ncbi:restriction endonuclease subunit S [Streptomyces coelicoflavus]|uniref:restriction endonuclease subunit S n=1 Tax=Streptomyces coelicoflavus TaxID=285562 RepID=UPI0036C8CF40